MDPVATPNGDAIIAPGTPPGIGRRAMLRLSGPDLIETFSPIFRPRLPDTGSTCLKTRVDIGSDGSTLEVPCIVLASKAPRSFTGEDVVEILLPANPSLLQRVESTLRTRYARRTGVLRPAGPGEFTARAFLGGRLDAASVTGVALAIAADERRGLDAANRWREQGDATEVAAASAALTAAIARLEAGIDFTDEEDVVGCSAGELRVHLDSVRSPLRTIRETMITVTAAGSDRFRVVLAGPPNAGKSSLFNRLVDAERTVAHDRAGTTRDAIEVDVDLDDGFGRIGVTFVDTAGIGATTDPLRDSATDATDQARRTADLELWCVPADEWIEGGERSPSQSTPRLEVVTKSDLAGLPTNPVEALCCSAVSGEGIEDVRRTVAHRAERRAGLGVVSMRLLDDIRRDLEAGLSSIDEAISLLDGIPDDSGPAHPEIVASVAREALDTIGRRFGGHDPESVLELIFGSFCIGK